MANNKELYKNIENFLKKQEHPVSTREIARHIKKAWHTTMTACLNLKIDGKIDSFVAGKAQLWYIKK